MKTDLKKRLERLEAVAAATAPRPELRFIFRYADPDGHDDDVDLDGPDVLVVDVISHDDDPGLELAEPSDDQLEAAVADLERRLEEARKC